MLLDMPMALRSIEPGLRFSILDFATLTVRTVIADSRQAAREGQLRREFGGITDDPITADEIAALQQP